jgi:tRNA-dependent cyclodipeptide synthase
MKYFYVTQEEIDKKLFNIFIGISLGNKLLTPELAKKYVRWAHKNTKDDAVVLIADDIDIINWMIFKGLNREEAKKKVCQKGYGLKGLFDKAIRELAREEKDPTYIANVHIIFWSDIRNKGYDHLKEILAEEYKINEEFHKQVLHFVDKYIELRDAEVSDEDKDKLTDYIISELPTLLGGIYWNNTLYNLILYPTYIDSEMGQFVLDIRGGKYFNASKLLLRQLCILVEDYMEKPKDLKLLRKQEET